MTTVLITVHGKVQGVFFRKYAREAAEKAGVTGFVRNQPSGEVYMEVSGDDSRVQSMIQWCHKGSPSSAVEKVEVTPVAYRAFHDFSIRY